MTSPLDAIARVIRTALVTSGSSVPVLGISGTDTAGKTTVSGELTRLLSMEGAVRLVHMDDFLRHANVRRQDPDPVRGYLEDAFDRWRVVREILEPARQARMTPGTIVILEGVLLYRPPVDRYLTYRVQLLVTDHERRRRIRSRDEPRFGASVFERYRRRYEPAERLYHKRWDPAQRVDLWIENTHPNAPRILSGRGLTRLKPEHLTSEGSHC